MKRPRLKFILFTLLALAVAALGVAIKRDLWAEPSVERCLNCPLPAGAHVVAETGYVRLFNGDRWYVVEMTEAQFHDFCAKAGMKHRADLLDYWGTCFAAPPDIPWLHNVINDQNTVYGEINDALDVARWEDGKAYVHHSVS